ncbi:MAG: hypothetical protein ACFE9R_01225 [Candidatus Hermodarchaeota archaeon]
MKFPHEFLKKLENDSKPIPRENCGTEGLLENNYLHNNADPNSENDTERENLSQLYDKFQDETNPISRVVFDAQFPDSFKEILKSSLPDYSIPTWELSTIIKNQKLARTLSMTCFKRLTPSWTRNLTRFSYTTSMNSTPPTSING